MGESPKMEGYAVGFVLGVLSSLLAAWLFEYGARPSLVVEQARVWGLRRQYPSGGAFLQASFFHVEVHNRRRRFGLLGPRPALSTHATIQVDDEAGNVHIHPIDGRWSAHPEPVSPTTGGLLVDPGRMLEGRTIDVHGHEPRELCLAIKCEGESDAFLFNNHSYYHPQWKNPAWRLPLGSHRVRVSVLYEAGLVTKDFRLVNHGTSRDDLRFEAL